MNFRRPGKVEAPVKKRFQCCIGKLDPTSDKSIFEA